MGEERTGILRFALNVTQGGRLKASAEVGGDAGQDEASDGD
jgi:hypothetical protein